MFFFIGRRRFFVHRRFQARFIAIFSVFAVSGAVVAAVATRFTVDGVLRDAMFRAHFSARSTGAIILPELLKVNALVAGVAFLASVVVAALLFRWSAARLDDICSRLAQWEQRLAGAVGPAAPLARDDPRHWTVDLERAVLAADASLRARYRPIAARAARLADTARQLQADLVCGPPNQVVAKVALISNEIGALDEDCARFEV